MQPDLFSEAKSSGYRCSCCGQWCKMYTRRLSGTMAAVLLLMYRHGKLDWTHTEDFLKSIGRPGLRADFHKLTFWGLLEKKEGKKTDGNPRNGFYKITGRGIAFCIGDYKVRAAVKIYNNKNEGFEGEEITIRQALGVKFNYETLMSE